MTLETFLDKRVFWQKRLGVKLTTLKSQQDINQVADVMRDTTEMDEVREHAGASLGRIGTDYIVDLLEHDLLHTNDYKSRLFCLLGLTVTEHEKANSIILDRLIDENEDGRIRVAACYALGNRKHTDVIPYTIQYINEPFMTEDSFLGSNRAVATLLKFQTPEAMDAIIDWSMMAVADKGRPAIQRERAATYLKDHGDERCVNFLIEMIDDDAVKKQRITAGKSRNHAVEGLKRIGTPAALAAVNAWQKRQPAE